MFVTVGKDLEDETTKKLMTGPKPGINKLPVYIKKMQTLFAIYSDRIANFFLILTTVPDTLGDLKSFASIKWNCPVDGVR